MLQCDRCRMHVHMSCYGVKEYNNGRLWLCDVCRCASPLFLYLHRAGKQTWRVAAPRQVGGETVPCKQWQEYFAAKGGEDCEHANGEETGGSGQQAKREAGRVLRQ